VKRPWKYFFPFSLFDNSVRHYSVRHLELGFPSRFHWAIIERFSKDDATSTRTSFLRERSESRTPPRRKQIVI
jgi:hypothetical protein